MTLFPSAERKWLRYEPDRDQRYDFEHAGAGVCSVELRQGRFAWPADAAEWDAVFLEAQVRAAAAAGWRAPQIDAHCGSVTVSHSFERSAAGMRYLNLSAIAAARPAAGSEMVLGTKGLQIPTQKARLIGFLNGANAATGPVLVIAPHPDDAEIAAFGLYSSLASAAWVATITTGEGGGFLGRVIVDPRERARSTARIRVLDSLVVPQMGGVPPERIVNLCYPDGGLKEMYQSREVASGSASAGAARSSSARLSDQERTTLRGLNRVEAAPGSATAGSYTWRNLVEELAELIRRAQPRIIAAPHPGMDEHPDHVFTTMAVAEALALTGIRDGEMYLYVTHSPQTALYPFGGNEDTVTLPPHFGEPLPFRSIVSHPLSAEMMRMKALALESMHDLRTIPAEGKMGAWRTALRTLASETRGKITGLGRDPSSFSRRAVRPNELFFVVAFSEISEVVKGMGAAGV